MKEVLSTPLSCEDRLAAVKLFRVVISEGGMGIVGIEAADRWRKGRVLRDERVKAGLSPAEGAAIRGLTVFEQNEIENGRADIPPRLLAKRSEPQRESRNV